MNFSCVYIIRIIQQEVKIKAMFIENLASCTLGGSKWVHRRYLKNEVWIFRWCKSSFSFDIRATVVIYISAGASSMASRGGK